MRNDIAVAGALTGLLALSGTASGAPAVTVHAAWFRALPANLPSAGYFTLRNRGGRTITLVEVKSPACGMLMPHKSEKAGGMAKMEEMTTIDIPAGAALTFAPGGYHLMCMNPTAALKPGAQVDVTLIFGDGTETTARFAVRGAAGKE